MSHGDLVSRAAKWLSNTRGCSVVFTEFATYAGERPDAIGFMPHTSVLVECKASRSDFLTDKHKPWRRVTGLGMGGERYYMAPPNTIKPDELPEKWGLLEVSGRRVRLIKRSGGFPERNRRNEAAFMVSMLRRAQLRIGKPLDEWLRCEQGAA